MKKPPSKTAPTPPEFLGKTGRNFWFKVHGDYVLQDAHHLRLLANACRALDVIEAAREQVKADGLVVKNRFGELREHPSANTERQSMQLFRQTIRELGLDIQDGPAAPRGPARPGARC